MGLVSTFIRQKSGQLDWEYGIIHTRGAGQEKLIPMGTSKSREVADASAWMLTITGKNAIEGG